MCRASGPERFARNWSNAMDRRLRLRPRISSSRIGKDTVPSGEPSTGHGRLAQLLAGVAADVVRDALRRADVGADQGFGGICVVLRVRNDSQGTGQMLWIAVCG